MSFSPNNMTIVMSVIVESFIMRNKSLTFRKKKMRRIQASID